MGRSRASGLAVVVLLLTLVVACGGGEGTAAETTPPSSTGGTTTTTAPAPLPTAPPPAPPPGPAPVPRPVVVIDPGHNGANGTRPDIIDAPVDAGGFTKACNTTGTQTDAGVSESSINWAVALRLRDLLAAQGIDVLLTRDSDEGVGPCVDERGQTAARAGASALVSIHADGAPAEDSGFHVIHPGEVAGYTDGLVEPSSRLAAAVRDAMVGQGFTAADYIGDQGLVERNDLGTLNRAGVPSVMVESGNLRHEGDAALLSGAEGQARLAEALAAGVVAYLG